MSFVLDPELMSAEGERIEQVLRRLESFVSPPGRAALKLPRLGDGPRAPAGTKSDQPIDPLG
jgi:hypothetical protein